jgi:hypothetical protein
MRFRPFPNLEKAFIKKYPILFKEKLYHMKTPTTQQALTQRYPKIQSLQEIPKNCVYIAEIQFIIVSFGKLNICFVQHMLKDAKLWPPTNLKIFGGPSKIRQGPI